MCEGFFETLIPIAKKCTLHIQKVTSQSRAANALSDSVSVAYSSALPEPSSASVYSKQATDGGDINIKCTQQHSKALGSLQVYRRSLKINSGRVPTWEAALASIKSNFFMIFHVLYYM